MADFIHVYQYLKQPNPHPWANSARELNDKFAYYRIGREWDSDDRFDIYETHNVPYYQGPWPGIDLARDFDFLQRMQADVRPRGRNVWDIGVEKYALQRYGPGSAASPGSDREAYDRAKEMARLVNPHFPNPPTAANQFRFVKLLGWGGNGVAALFKQNAPGAQSYHVVKTSLKDDPAERLADVQHEAGIMGAFIHYPHIIQATHNISPELIVMQYSKRGTLNKVLTATQASATRLSANRGHAGDEEPVPFSDRFLWHIFDCLLQGVIAMRFPPIHWAVNANPHQANHNEPLPSLADMTAQPPRYDDVNNGGGWVHFDIDPSNSNFNTHCKPVRLMPIADDNTYLPTLPSFTL